MDIEFNSSSMVIGKIEDYNYQIVSFDNIVDLVMCNRQISYHQLCNSLAISIDNTFSC